MGTVFSCMAVAAAADAADILRLKANPEDEQHCHIIKTTTYYN